MAESEYKVSIDYVVKPSDRAAQDLEVDSSCGFGWFVLSGNGLSLAKGVAHSLPEADAEARDAIEELIRQGDH